VDGTLVALALFALSCANKAAPEVTSTRDDTHGGQSPAAGRVDAGRDSIGTDSVDSGLGQSPGSISPGDASAERVEADPMGCFLYYQALCTRIAQCRNLPRVIEGCLDSAMGCVELADGTSATNRGLRTCAEAYEQFACEDLVRGRRLNCVSAGERAAGEQCSLGLQCESLLCDFRGEDLRECALTVNNGEECSQSVLCQPGNDCVDGRCETTPAPNFDNGNLPLGAAGEQCRDPHQCQAGLYCQFDEDADLGLCAPRPRVGSACGLTRGYDWAVPLPAACDDHGFCIDGKCEPLPALGEFCAPSTFVDQPPCASGYFCDLQTGQCAAWRDIGELCDENEQRSGLTGLPLDPQCDVELGARCSCPDGGADCDGATRRCLIRVLPGAACDLDYSVCTYGTHCIAGICDYELGIAPEQR